MYPQDSINSWFEGQGHWSDVPASNWNDWKWQLRNRLTTLDHLERFLDLTPEERKGALLADKKLALAITPYFFNLIDKSN